MIGPPYPNPRPRFNVLGWIAAFAVIEIAWFAFVWPMIPSTLLGLSVEAIFPFLIAGYVFLVILAITRLNTTVSNRKLFKTLRAILGLSVGPAIFVTAYYFQTFMEANFQYHH